MVGPDIYDFESFSEFIAAKFRWMKWEDPRWTYANLAKLVGSVSAQALNMIAQGRRSPSDETLQSLARALDLGEAERAYAKVLIAAEKPGDKAERSRINDQLRAMREAAGRISGELFELSEDVTWFDVLVLELIDTGGFSADPEWISRRLGRRIDPVDCRRSLQKLERLKLIERDDSTLQRYRRTMSSPSGPSEARRQAHQASGRAAVDALDVQPTGVRHFTGVTLAVSNADLEKIFASLDGLADKFVNQAHAPGGDELYQLNLQFFRVTDPTARMETGE